ncbi:hypothetical protein E2C01_015012 [Portunus trituberculatus]|uniref:Uncharacterized protein n=1 Tax=Portunus trituberculatus TaxID=210409 RepID=A0A5B7DLK3_PORTR|nr:hypothetical protein [Portunus trituberculatus]
MPRAGHSLIQADSGAGIHCPTAPLPCCPHAAARLSEAEIHPWPSVRRTCDGVSVTETPQPCVTPGESHPLLDLRDFLPSSPGLTTPGEGVMRGRVVGVVQVWVMPLAVL